MKNIKLLFGSCVSNTNILRDFKGTDQFNHLLLNEINNLKDKVYILVSNMKNYFFSLFVNRSNQSMFIVKVTTYQHL